MVFPTHKLEEANRLEELVHTRHSTVACLPREAGDLGASQVMQENLRMRTYVDVPAKEGPADEIS